MSFPPVELLPYAKYAAPPVIGAVIGYVTNRVAIKMLFRPLKAWRVAGIKVPMTPGVIPSKRSELAQNMGEVVGDHLLTSKEISRGLQQDVFQKQLLFLIEQRIKGVLNKDLDNLPSLIPEKFRVYFNLACKTGIYKVKENIQSFINSDRFTSIADEALDNRIDFYLDQELSSIFSLNEREILYLFIEKNLSRMLSSPEMEQWIDDFVHQKISATINQEKSLADILPESLQELLLDSLDSLTPPLLEKMASILRQPDVRDNIVKGVCGGVDNFIDSLGSMAEMVRGFLKMEMVEEKIREYLIEKDDDIVTWLKSEKVQKKVVGVIKERCNDFLHKPIVEYVKTDADVVENFCSHLSGQLTLLIRSEEVTSTLADIVKSNIEIYIDSGNIKMSEVATGLVGGESVQRGKTWLKGEVVSLLKSAQTISAIDSMVEALVAGLMARRIGKLANIIPAGVREGLSRSMQKITSAMLETEVPGLVRTLNIRRIVTEKVNSLDLLKLEGLLLTIMEEQFKYINLFGALLGFVIGCLNLLVLK